MVESHPVNARPRSSCPRVLVAGTGSGVGKTSVALGLVRALRRRGLSVRPYKVGPDFLDPTHLSIAAGNTCFNLDTWMSGCDYVRRLFAGTSRDHDIAVIEGAMGLFDGASVDSSEGSAAEVARLLGAPVLLVCDAHGQVRSLAATVKGFAGFEPDLRLCGVIANRCGSERHRGLLEQALRAAGLPPLLGGVTRGAFPSLESRHLGLVSADARSLTDERLDRLADALEFSADIDAIVDLAGQAPPIESVEPPEPRGEVKETTGPREPLRLGIAFDSAFHFYYPDNLEVLEEHGFELVRFSPISDSELPADLQSLYLGGGYPELFAETLSGNSSMLQSLRAFCRSGRPVYAECGGLMLLSQGIVTRDRSRYPMAGVLPGACKMLDRFKSLGYAEVELLADCLWGTKGERLRGHEFHYSEFEMEPGAGAGWDTVYKVSYRRSDLPVREGYQLGNVLASYVHLHLASRPGCIAHLTDVCRKQPENERGGFEHARL